MMKESFTINKPHIAEEFIAQLMMGVKEVPKTEAGEKTAEAAVESKKTEGKKKKSGEEEKKDEVVEKKEEEYVMISRSHLNHCFGTLASSVMARERHNFEK